MRFLGRRSRWNQLNRTNQSYHNCWYRGWHNQNHHELNTLRHRHINNWQKTACQSMLFRNIAFIDNIGKKRQTAPFCVDDLCKKCAFIADKILELIRLIRHYTRYWPDVFHIANSYFTARHEHQRRIRSFVKSLPRNAHLVKIIVDGFWLSADHASSGNTIKLEVAP